MVHPRKSKCHWQGVFCLDVVNIVCTRYICDQTYLFGKNIRIINPQNNIFTKNFNISKNICKIYSSNNVINNILIKLIYTLSKHSSFHTCCLLPFLLWIFAIFRSTNFATCSYVFTLVYSLFSQSEIIFCYQVQIEAHT